MISVRCPGLNCIFSQKINSVHVELLADLYDKYVVVPSDKASNNIVFVCMTHHMNCLTDMLGLNTSEGNPTILAFRCLRNYESVLLSFAISTANEDFDFPQMYWIPR